MKLIGLVTYADDPLAVVRYVLLNSTDKPSLLDDPQWLEHLDQTRAPSMNAVAEDQIEKLGFTFAAFGEQPDTEFDLVEHIEQLQIYVENGDISPQDKNACSQELASILGSRDSVVLEGIALAENTVLEDGVKP